MRYDYFFRFRYSWYAFLNLLDADYEIGFSCPKCGHHPETVVMDGVALGMRKQFMPWKKAPDPKKKEVPIFDGRYAYKVYDKAHLSESILCIRRFCHSQARVLCCHDLC